jgi:glycosyltransferase involved in cell wall biosynthesis
VNVIRAISAGKRLGLSAWKRLPPRVRQAAHLTAQKSLKLGTPLIVRIRWKRGAHRSNGPISIVGFFRSTSGLGQGARLFAQALADRTDALIDVTERLNVRANLAPIADQPTSPGSGGVLLSHLNPLELERLLQMTWAGILKGRRHIGYWAWELPVAPAGWRRACDYVDEVWAPSEFTARAVRAIAPKDLPVHVAPHPVGLMPHGAPARARFGLAEDVVVVLVALDMRSTLARKNPLGALKAYRAAAAASARRSVLVCKVSNFDADHQATQALLDGIEGHAGVVVIDEPLSALDMSSLVASADIVLSLHRSEGFGLMMAEGMWLGKAVIATGWSGNMDFMDGDSSVLIPYTLVPVEDPQGMYSGSVWAEPDLDDASEKLAWLIDSEPARQSLGQAARRRAERVFDPERWRRRIDQILDGGDIDP